MITTHPPRSSQQATARVETVRRARAGETVLVVVGAPRARRHVMEDLLELAPDADPRFAAGLESLRFPSGGHVRLVGDCRGHRADAVVGPSSADGIRFLVDVHGAAYLGVEL